jgi:hypothetical protein
MDTEGSRKRIWLAVGGVILLALVIYFIDVGRLVIQLQLIGWWQVGAATIVLLTGYILLTVRLRYVLLNKTGWWETFYANSIGYMVHITMFGPALVVRAVSISLITPIPITQASSAVLVERLLDMVMRLFATILAVALLASEQTNPSTSVGGSLFLLLVIFGTIIWITRNRERVVNGLASRVSRWGYASEEKVRSTAVSTLQSLEAVSSTRRLMVSLLLSYATWISFLIFQYLVLAAITVNLPSIQMWLIAVVVLAVMPPSVNVLLIIYHIVVIGVLVALQLTDTTTAVIYAVFLHFIQMVCWNILGRSALHRTGLTLRQMMDEVKEHARQQKPVENDAKGSVA